MISRKSDNFQKKPLSAHNFQIKIKNCKPNVEQEDIIAQKAIKTHFKNKTQEWLVTKKNVLMYQDEEVIEQFNCGYSGNIVVTGKIYITNKRIFFYSAFNDKNIFFDSTFFQIDKKDILKIQKKYNAKVFNNSIQITLNNLQKIFFTSFVSRDQCYDLMITYLQPKKAQSQPKLKKKKTQYDLDTQFLINKIIFQQFQYFIHSFSCGYSTKVNIMGRIYITNKRIYFYSSFSQERNCHNSTQIDIRDQDIERIQKRYNALVFDNSILIITKKGAYCFNSFFARDKIFYILLDIFKYGKQISKISQEDEENFQQYDIQDILKQQKVHHGVQKLNESIKPDFIRHQNQLAESINLQKKKQTKIQTYQEEIDTQKVSQQQFKKLVHQSDDISQEELIKRQIEIKKLMKNPNQNMEIIGETILKFPGLNAMKALRIFDSGQQFFMEGKVYDNFMKFFKSQILKRKYAKISRWTPNILQFLNISNIKSGCPLQFQRQIEEVLKIQKIGIPFMPKQANSKQSQKLYLISKDKYIIDSFIKSSGPPFADNFYNIGRKTVQTISQDEIKVAVTMVTIFNKKTLLGPIIQSKCEQQGKKTQQIMFGAMKKYLKILQQSKIKN